MSVFRQLALLLLVLPVACMGTKSPQPDAQMVHTFGLSWQDGFEELSFHPQCLEDLDSDSSWHSFDCVLTIFEYPQRVRASVVPMGWVHEGTGDPDDLRLAMIGFRGEFGTEGEALKALDHYTQVLKDRYGPAQIQAARKTANPDGSPAHIWTDVDERLTLQAHPARVHEGWAVIGTVQNNEVSPPPKVTLMEKVAQLF